MKDLTERHTIRIKCPNCNEEHDVDVEVGLNIKPAEVEDIEVEAL